MTTASAPGKLMLFGEYAVLEGHRSLALCFDRRIACTATDHDAVVLDSPGVFEPPIELPVAALESAEPPDERLRLLWPLLQAHGCGVKLVFDANFPPTWGLGSSSASTLAASAALATLRGEAPDEVATFEQVLGAQRALQGAASGYDVATQQLGGAVADRAEAVERERLPDRDFAWVVAYTGHKASTASMIRSVRQDHPVGAPIYAEIGALADRGIEAWMAGDAAALGARLNEGQALLERLGAAPTEIVAILRALQADPDVLGARLAGAGGGDCILILADDPELAAAAARAHGLTVLPLAPETQGLTWSSP